MENEVPAPPVLSASRDIASWVVEQLKSTPDMSYAHVFDRITRMNGLSFEEEGQVAKFAGHKCLAWAAYAGKATATSNASSADSKADVERFFAAAKLCAETEEKFEYLDRLFRRMRDSPNHYVPYDDEDER